MNLYRFLFWSVLWLRLSKAGNMNRFFKMVFIVVPVFTAGLAFAEPSIRVNSKQLINDKNTFDGKNVVFTGEIIGDIMPRGSNAWCNIQDDDNVIGVFAPGELFRIVHQTGDYQHQGDTVEIEGKFLRFDPQLKGEMSIRAYRIKILKFGYQMAHVVDTNKEEAAFGLAVVAALLVAFTIYIVRIRRKKG